MKTQTRQPNWDYVKKTTLWRYEELINKLKVVAAYPVIHCIEDTGNLRQALPVIMEE